MVSADKFKNFWKGTKFILGAFLILYALELLCRIVFVIFTVESSLWISTICVATYHGIQLDIAVASYGVLLLIFGWVISDALQLVKRNGNSIRQQEKITEGSGFTDIKSQNISFKSVTILALSFLVLIFHALVLFTDIFFYRFWQWRLNAQSLAYLQDWKTVLKTLPSVVWWGFFGLLTLIAALWIVIRKPLRNKTNSLNSPTLLPTLLCVPALIILSRGGIGSIPLNLGSALKSSNKITQTAAINGVWNAVFSLSNSSDSRNLSHVLVDTSMENWAWNWYHPKRNRSVTGKNLRDFWLQNPQVLPNIHVIVLEGVNQHWFERNNSPFSNLLSEKSNFIQFNHCYAVGDRTDKGLAALLSGWTGEPGTGILFSPNRWNLLQGLPRELSNSGYKSEFWYGGDISFANQDAFLRQMGMDFIYEETDIKQRLENLKSIDSKLLKWGYSDLTMAALFEKSKTNSTPTKYITKRNNTPVNQPVFKTWLTLSSHEPFDELANTENMNQKEQFQETLKKVDLAVFRYLDALKKSSEWENSMVIIVSDHGKVFGLEDVKWSESEFFRIPLWIGGGALKSNLKGQNWTANVSQSDIYATLAQMLSVDWQHESNPWGRSMINFNSSSTAICFKGEYSILVSETKESFGHLHDKLRTSDSLDLYRRALQSKILRKYFRF